MDTRKRGSFVGTRRLERGIMEKKMPNGVPVLIVGDSGTGKSSSVGRVLDDEGRVLIKGLPPENTVFLNTEQQVMPIENFNEFKNIHLNNWTEVIKELKKWIDLHAEKTPEEEKKWVKRWKDKGEEDPRYKYKYMVFDSLTSATEMLQLYCDKFNGWDKWNEYNARLYRLLTMFKKLKIQVFILGIPELNPAEDQSRKYMAVKGKDMRFGKIEKEFVVVLHTKPFYDEESIDGEMIASTFTYKSNRKNLSKSPPRMFKGVLINDLGLVAKGIEDYYDKGNSKK